ncbi:hypothetical protein QAD02_018073 [Eretmocerus hayati]|uniref:Uncharacterized protein n=1 Tax=Eretmocerus hayati TaxID=131215 RepID=A0ACC2PFM5_9HYME|nr:hypothetical protein QAD02_018073 [Eretmocerus hayati]
MEKETLANNRQGDAGLKVPGSNWEKYKNIVTQPAPVKQTSQGSPPKRKKFSQRNGQARENIPQDNVVDKVISCILLIIKFIGYLIKCIYVHLTEDLPQEPLRKPKENDRKMKPSTGLTKAIAMDCEMVGIGDGQESMIARVSIVNQNGFCVYDKYVKPTEPVVDYRTAVSGIRPQHLQNGHDFTEVQREVAEILRGRILVGHALHNDLAVLFLNHPRRLQRDTSRYKLFRKVTKGATPSLKKLSSELLGVDIQSGEHDSIEDAKATMQLYQLFKKKWECDVRERRPF